MRKFYMALMALFLTACGSFQTTVQKDDAAKLQIVGNTNNAYLTLDNGKAVYLEDMRTFTLNGKTVTQIDIKPGTHEVLIKRDGQTLVHRKLYVSSENAVEVVLP